MPKLLLLSVYFHVVCIGTDHPNWNPHIGHWCELLILTRYLISWKCIQCENCKKKGYSDPKCCISVDRMLMVGLARRRPHFRLVRPQHKETFGAQEEILALRAPDVFNWSTDRLLLKFDCVKLCHKLMMQRGELL